MSTIGVKEVESLGKRRQGLVDEAQELRREGQRRQVVGQPIGDIARRLAQIDADLKGVNFDFKAARREVALDQVRKLASDRQFQGVLLAALQPLIALADAVEARRGEGVGLPPLPPMLTHLAAEARAYLAGLDRIGAREDG